MGKFEIKMSRKYLIKSNLIITENYSDILNYDFNNLTLPKNCVIAGGCFKDIINNEPIKDFDLFFLNESDYFEALKFYRKKEFTLVYENNNAVRFSDGINNYEIIRHINETVEGLINSFDFEITKMALTTKTIKDPNSDEEKVIPNKLFYNERIIDLIKNKILSFDDSLNYPYSTLKRVIRYVSKGYRIDNKDLSYLAQYLNMIDEEELFNEIYFSELD